MIRATAISNTYGLHRDLKLSGGDILIHTGNILKPETLVQAGGLDFFDWLTKQDYSYMLFSPSERDLNYGIQNFQNLPSNCFLLCNTGVTIQGKTFWSSVENQQTQIIVSSPITFKKLSRMQIDIKNAVQRMWANIPPKLDCLLTNQAPLGHLDAGEGCEILSEKLKLLDIRYVVFGGSPSCSGTETTPTTTFINASVAKTGSFPFADPVIISKPINFTLA